MSARLRGAGAACLVLIATGAAPAAADSARAGAPDTAPEATGEATPEAAPEATADGGLAVSTAAIQRGRLVIRGTAPRPGARVELDGRFATHADAGGAFSFVRLYLPANCIVELTSLDRRLRAVVQYCGPRGKRGPKGPDGARGARGPAGPDGAPGPAGPAGPRGATGAAGATGPAGPAGATGPVGPVGPTGATGATGPIGPTGARGPSGIVQVLTATSGVQHSYVAGTAQVIPCTVEITTTGGQVRLDGLHTFVPTDDLNNETGFIDTRFTRDGVLLGSGSTWRAGWSSEVPSDVVQTVAPVMIDSPPAGEYVYFMMVLETSTGDATLGGADTPCLLVATEYAPQQ